MKDIFYGKNGVAVVLEIDNSIVFVKQYRATANCEMFEIPGGAVDPGETPEQAAIRELKEETGYILDRVEFVVGFYTNPGISTNKIDIFKAKISEKDLKCVNADDCKKISVIRREIKDLKVEDFLDAKTIVALYALGYIKPK